MPTIATIGVYGFDARRSSRAADADVGLVLDVRQRRGVRGSEYAWANAQRLQAALADAGIDYRTTELAPTTELRQLQYREDDRRGVGKRSRTELAPEYAERYTARDPRPRGPRRRSSNCAGSRGRAALRRARPGGLSPLADRGAAAGEHGLPVVHLKP